MGSFSTSLKVIKIEWISSVAAVVFASPQFTVVLSASMKSDHLQIRYILQAKKQVKAKMTGDVINYGPLPLFKLLLRFTDNFFPSILRRSHKMMKKWDENII